MPVQIDEVSAEIAPVAGENAPASSPRSNEPSPESEMRKQRDGIARLEIRAARLAAD